MNKNKKLTKAPKFQAHPWHGISPGLDLPEVVTAFIEIVPTDTVKFEIDKESGFLKVDRPQLYSSYTPLLYGFIPQTFCGTRVGKACAAAINRPKMQGDQDPLDICVLSERQILTGNILVRARPIGVLRVIDRDEADDKIVAVLEKDAVYGNIKEISELPELLIDRLRHYFLTYKEIPGASATPKVSVSQPLDRSEAYKIIKLSRQDYQASFK